MSYHVQSDQGKKRRKILVFVILALHSALNEVYIKKNFFSIHSNNLKVIPAMIYQGNLKREIEATLYIPNVKGFNRGY